MHHIVGKQSRQVPSWQAKRLCSIQTAFKCMRKAKYAPDVTCRWSMWAGLMRSAQACTAGVQCWQLGAGSQLCTRAQGKPPVCFQVCPCTMCVCSAKALRCHSVRCVAIGPGQEQQQQAECMHAQPHAFTSLPCVRDVYVCKWGCIMLTRLSVHQCMHIQKSGSRKVWWKTLPACCTNVYLLLLWACLWCVEEVPELQCIRTMQRLRHTTLSRQQRAQHTAVPASTDGCGSWGM